MWAIFNKLFRRTTDPVLAKTLKKQKSSTPSLKGLEWLNRLAVLIGAVAVITLFLPNADKVEFIGVEEGQPWHRPPLIALQGFYVNMPADQFQKEQDSVRRLFEPYFNLKEEVKENVIQRIKVTADTVRKKIAPQYPGLTREQVNEYVISLNTRLDAIYDKGVIKNRVIDSLKQRSDHPRIRILVNNKQKEPTDLDDINSLTDAFKSAERPVLDEKSLNDTLQEVFLQALGLDTLIQENLEYDKEKSTQALNERLKSMTDTIATVLQNEKIIDRGEIITKEKKQKIDAYQTAMKAHASSKKSPEVLIGQILFVLLVMVVLNSFLYIYRRDYFLNKRAYLMLFILPTIFCAITGTMEQYTVLHVYAIPFCMVPIVIRIFLDSRVAFIFHLATVLIASIYIQSRYEFLILQIIAGMVAVQSLRQMTQRSQILKTMTIVTLTLLATHFIYTTMTAENMSNDPTQHDPYWWITVGGVLLLFVYPLFWIMEKCFGFTSEVTLVELSDTNNRLLQKLMEEAPGTFQHSMQVAILASEVASKIKANVQLVRTGAYYHDIGKLSRPVFFTENQSGKNPHERISPIKSAEVIIGHVTYGIKLAEEENLPDVIKRFILTHHGKGKAKYFYVTYKNEHPEAEIDESKFTYPGPNPESKEEAILMMADAIEAASRSLPEYTEETISSLVDRIVDGQVNEGFFNDSNLTFHDVQVAKKAFKERLKTIYHTRISYPELIKTEENEGGNGEPQKADADHTDDSNNSNNNNKNNNTNNNNNSDKNTENTSSSIKNPQQT